MASPSPRKPNAKPRTPNFSQYPPRPEAGLPEVVDPLWLLKAGAAVVVLALACGYLSLCLLLYQGQWQLVLHPRRTPDVPATIDGTPVQLVRFATDDTGSTQLTGWSIAAPPNARYAGITVLLLPSGDGSLVDALPKLTTLHGVGVTLFAVDYRGYGQSVAVHPNQERMMGDADSALAYLTTHGLPPAQIVPYGVGVGASLAVHLAATHADLPALILDSPGPDPLETVLHDPRTGYLPVRWLLHDRFPLAGLLTTLQTPKLLISDGTMHPAFATAASPRRTVELPAGSAGLADSLRRFFDETLPGGSISHP